MFFNIKKVFIFLIGISICINAKNLGHRLGGDIYKPENTLFSYKKALKKLQDKKSFHYVEFDIRESKDGKLVVFHDSKIERIVPKTKHNLLVLSSVLKKKKFNKIKIKDLPLKIISKLQLEKKAHIPTLKDVLEASVKWKLKKPMKIEIKLIRSDKARYRLVETILNYNKKLDIILIAFSKNFYKSFPLPSRWIKVFKDNDLKCYQIDKYEFTASKFNDIKPLNYTTLLSESPFSVNKGKSRRKEFLFFLPKKINSNNSIKVGVYGGADNSGDKGITFRVETKNKELLFSGFSNAKGWEWFEFSNLNTRELILILEDYDTKFTGKNPGNTGKIKVLFSI